ncbi:MAG: helix-turn-helix domain-containing protein [Halanaerobiales bacterium]|nr:helix-turn-helix domain-containing protein [Halanaerobiales bacterium]
MEILPTVKEVLLELIKDNRNNLPFALGVKDLMRLIPFSQNQIYLMLDTKQIPGKKIGGKWVIQRDAFLAWYYGVYQDDEFAREVKI